MDVTDSQLEGQDDEELQVEREEEEEEELGYKTQRLRTGESCESVPNVSLDH